MVVTDPITNPYLRDAQTNVHQRNALVDEYFRKPIVALRLLTVFFTLAYCFI